MPILASIYRDKWHIAAWEAGSGPTGLSAMEFRSAGIRGGTKWKRLAEAGYSAIRAEHCVVGYGRRKT